MNRLFESERAYRLTLFAFVNSINILLLLVSVAGFAIYRPVIIYDYFIIIVLLFLRVPAWFTWLCFVVIFILDILARVSFTYLFGIGNMVKNMEFTELFGFSWYHYLFFSIGAIALGSVYPLIKRFSAHSGYISKRFVAASFGFLAVVFVLDLLSGDSVFNGKKILPFIKINLGGNALKDAAIDIRDALANQEPERLSFSLAYSTFSKDSSSNQLLVLAESWGLLASADDQAILNNALVARAVNQGWTVEMGTTSFSGSTTSAELRELYGVKGDYRYFLDAAKSQTFKSILNLKKEQGYFTLAAHSFSGRMFDRNIWWINAGVDTVIFADSPGLQPIAEEHVNHESPFIALDDEFTYACLSNASSAVKKFGYLLTVNSHLPFRGDTQTKEEFVSFIPLLSKEANGQLQRVQQLIAFLINEASTDGWDKVLIIGDHMPPYTNQSDRSAYSSQQVPFILLTRK